MYRNKTFIAGVEGLKAPWRVFVLCRSARKCTIPMEARKIMAQCYRSEAGAARAAKKFIQGT